MAKTPIVRNWLCQHNTADNTTTYDFGFGFQIIENRNTDMCYKIYNGTAKSKFPINGISLETWEQILINFSIEASKYGTNETVDHVSIIAAQKREINELKGQITILKGCTQDLYQKNMNLESINNV